MCTTKSSSVKLKKTIITATNDVCAVWRGVVTRKIEQLEPTHEKKKYNNNLSCALLRAFSGPLQRQRENVECFLEHETNKMHGIKYYGNWCMIAYIEYTKLIPHSICSTAPILCNRVQLLLQLSLYAVYMSLSV